MPTGVQLRQLLTDLRAECGQSLDVAHGVNTREVYSHLLGRVQRQMATEVDWPILRGIVEQEVLEGVRFYNEHPKMSFTNVNTAYAIVGGRTKELIYGLDASTMQFDEDGDTIKRWPVERWDYNGEFKQIEFYPQPSIDAVVVYEGTLNLDPLVDDNDRCTLDSDVIVLRAASEILARSNQTDAQAKATAGNSLMLKLLSQQRAQKRKPWVSGGGVYIGVNSGVRKGSHIRAY